MNVASIFLLLAVILLTGFYVAVPFFTRMRATRGMDQAVSALMAERDRILAALQDLDFDRALGKVSEEEYPSQREMLVTRGADILRKLDERQPAKPAAEPARQAAAKASAPAISSNDDIEDLIAARRAVRKEKTGGFCPQCGTPVLVSDRFCPKCGHSLK